MSNMQVGNRFNTTDVAPETTGNQMIGQKSPPPPPPPNSTGRAPPPPPSHNTGSPTQGAGGTTTAPVPGYASNAAEIEARLATHADYQATVKELEALKALRADMNLLANGEGNVSTSFLKAVSADGGRTQAERDAADRLLACPQLSEIMRGRHSRDDGLANTADLDLVISRREEKLTSIRTEVADALFPKPGNTGQVTSPSTGDTPPAGDTAPSPSPTPGPSPIQEILDGVPKPPPSTSPGMSGTLENLGNTADHLAKQMEAIANDPNLDPGVKAAKMAELQAKQQSVMNMLNQLSQMLSNVAKLWSDIAMNSVRNIK